MFDDQAGLSKERYDLIKENADAEIATLYIPQIDDAVKASQLVTYLGTLWASASAGQRNRLLRSVLDAIYVDLGSREIVGLRPRQVFLTLFEAIENYDAVTLSSNPTGHFGRAGGDGGERAPLLPWYPIAVKFSARPYPKPAMAQLIRDRRKQLGIGQPELTHRVGVSPSRRKPGEIHWAIYRRNLDGSEPRYYLSNAPEDTPLETLAHVGGSRWRIETEFETEKSDVGLDEYEARTPYQVRARLWAGWHHHVALCLLGGAFLLSLQQDWGERCPGSPGRRSTGWCERCCPGNGSGRLICCGGWRIRRTVTNGPDAPMPSAAPPCGHHPTSLRELTL